MLSGRRAPARPAAGSCQPPAPPHLGRTRLPHPSQKPPAGPEHRFFLPVLKWFGGKKTDGYGPWPVLPRIGVGLQHISDSFCVSEAPAGKQEAS